jgi:hypothetical protein
LRGQRQVAGASVTGVADIAGVGEKKRETIMRVMANMLIRGLKEGRSSFFVREEG